MTDDTTIRVDDSVMVAQGCIAVTGEVVTLVRWPDRWLLHGKKARVVSRDLKVVTLPEHRPDADPQAVLTCGTMALEALPDGEDWPE